MGEDAERMLTARPRSLHFAQLAIESQSRVKGHFRMISGGSGRMTWRRGSKGMSYSFHKFSRAYQGPDPGTATQNTKETGGCFSKELRDRVLAQCPRI